MWGVVSTASAATGFSKTKRCRTAKQQLAERQAQEPGVSEEQPADLVIQSVVVTPSVDTLTVGERVQLVATAVNSSGAVIANRLFTWSSSNDAIASVSNAGLIRAYAIGSVVIAARTDNIVGTANITVVSPN